MTFFAVPMICLVNFMRLLTCYSFGCLMENTSPSVKCNLKRVEANWMICTVVRALPVLTVSSKHGGLSNHSCAGSLSVL